MKTETLTVPEYARLLDMTPQHVSSQLRAARELPGVVSWRKIEGRTGAWLIDVSVSWVEENKSKNNP